MLPPMPSIPEVTYGKGVLEHHTSEKLFVPIDQKIVRNTK
jgi:hypothetical protein